MRTSRLAVAILTLTSMWSADAQAAANDSGATGIWMTDDGDGDGAVDIRPCGTSLCGYIYSILRIPDPSRPALDERNVKAELRTRPLCGIQVIGGVHATAPGQWGGGWIYDPKVGKTYGVDLTPQGQQLSVHGYLPGGFLGRTVTWTRPATPPAKCVMPKR